MDPAVRATLNNPHRWWGMSPNMPIYFCAIFVASAVLDQALQR